MIEYFVVFPCFWIIRDRWNFLLLDCLGYVYGSSVWMWNKSTIHSDIYVAPHKLAVTNLSHSNVFVVSQWLTNDMSRVNRCVSPLPWSLSGSTHIFYIVWTFSSLASSEVVVFLLNVSMYVLEAKGLDVIGDVWEALVEFLRAWWSGIVVIPNERKIIFNQYRQWLPSLTTLS